MQGAREEQEEGQARGRPNGDTPAPNHGSKVQEPELQGKGGSCPAVPSSLTASHLLGRLSLGGSSVAHGAKTNVAQAAFLLRWGVSRL